MAFSAKLKMAHKLSLSFLASAPALAARNVLLACVAFGLALARLAVGPIARRPQGAAVTLAGADFQVDRGGDAAGGIVRNLRLVGRDGAMPVPTAGGAGSVGGDRDRGRIGVAVAGRRDGGEPLRLAPGRIDPVALQHAALLAEVAAAAESLQLQAGGVGRAVGVLRIVGGAVAPAARAGGTAAPALRLIA